MRKLYSRSCDLVVEGLENRTFLTTAPFIAAKLNGGVNFDQISAPLIDKNAPAIDMGDPVDNHLDLTGDMTIETWVKFNSLPQKDEGFAFVSKDAGQGTTNKWIFGYANNTAAANKLFFHITNADGGFVWATSNEWNPTIGTWYHVAVTKTLNAATGKDVYRFYVGNTLRSDTQTQQYTFHVPDVNGTMLLGRAEYDKGVRADPNAAPPITEIPPSGFWLHGALDDVRIWNYPRTQTQIGDNYTKELTGSEAGLVGYWKLNETTGTTVDDATSKDTTGTLVDFLDFSVPTLHSNPSATAKLYLNFTGDFLTDWAGGTEKPLQIDPFDSDDDITTFSGEELAQMNDIWQVVSDAYSPFNIDVTTEAPPELLPGVVSQIDVGGDGQWLGVNKGGPSKASGVAVINGFTSTTPVDHIGFAFAYDIVKDPDTGDLIRVPSPSRNLGLIVSHEAGHTFGLHHQSVYAPDGTQVSAYHPGFPDKGPIMGAPYGSERFLWWNGTSTSRSVVQNDLSILSNSTNAFGYRTDDYGDTTAAATSVSLTLDPDTGAPTYKSTGIITTLNDVDVLKFTAGVGPLSIKVGSAFATGDVANMLDADIELRDGSGNLVKSARFAFPVTPPAGDRASIDYSIPSSGTYYLVIKSHGISGDIGQYTVKISGPAAPNGKINGTVFNDGNSDGAMGSGEAGLSGKTVFLDLNNDGLLSSGEQSTTTAADGTFGFTGLVDGTYKVRAVTTGFNLTTAIPSAVIASSNTISGVLIGLHALPSAIISGIVFKDTNNDGVKTVAEAGFAGQTVFLDTNNDGLLTSGESSTTTASDGSYSFTGLAAGTYKVRVVVPASYTQSTSIISVNLADAQTSSSNLIGLYTATVVNNASIAGTVFNDANNDGAKASTDAGFAGVTVFLDTNGDGLLTSGETSTTSASDGSYSFAGLAAGTYKVRAVAPSGYSQSTALQNVTVANGQAIIAVLIGLYKPATSTTGSISGVVYGDNNKNGVYDSGDSLGASRVVFLDLNGNDKLDTGEKQATTNASGVYTFSGLSAGTYHVRRVFPTGYVLSGSPIDVTLAAGQNLTNQNIGSKQGSSTGGGGGTGTSTGKISGFLFFDNNKNGIWDNGDNIQGGKTVFIDTNGDGKLTTGEKSTVTDAQGNYSFTGLAAGTYKIRRVLPTGYVISTPARNITLTSGQVVTNVTIGTKTA